jgi:hypothetical protein
LHCAGEHECQIELNCNADAISLFPILLGHQTEFINRDVKAAVVQNFNEITVHQFDHAEDTQHLYKTKGSITCHRRVARAQYKLTKRFAKYNTICVCANNVSAVQQQQRLGFDSRSGTDVAASVSLGLLQCSFRVSEQPAAVCF